MAARGGRERSKGSWEGKATCRRNVFKANRWLDPCGLMPAASMIPAISKGAQRWNLFMIFFADPVKTVAGLISCFDAPQRREGSCHQNGKQQRGCMGVVVLAEQVPHLVDLCDEAKLAKAGCIDQGLAAQEQTGPPPPSGSSFPSCSHSEEST
ncbi:hypothetical protein BDK51DRAFT_33151 [Blyttiomyces helicus]|uniref:Uncharacterized protein n=1 Tax=Blyttiomyces helicus TaxID=388810 RepID=A0A4P9W286_9FUNG|nr:hypothetical protein BDK51DRAFT_33151 [Blyttiomyces helicus]|eukprot:RKO84186.1 hypothetical protein BDK51DRAFT_33151 [Blyttiomyces helicus]